MVDRLFGRAHANAPGCVPLFAVVDSRGLRPGAAAPAGRLLERLLLPRQGLEASEQPSRKGRHADALLIAQLDRCLQGSMTLLRRFIRKQTPLEGRSICLQSWVMHVQSPGGSCPAAVEIESRWAPSRKEGLAGVSTCKRFPTTQFNVSC